jgi:hypothetical protein
MKRKLKTNKEVKAQEPYYHIHLANNGLSDREFLMLAYGALKAKHYGTVRDPLVASIEQHLFQKELK